jgi:hypothetical protein
MKFDRAQQNQTEAERSYYANGFRIGGCCGSVIYQDYDHFNMDNLGHGVMFNPDEEEIEPPLDGSFKLTYLSCGKDRLVVKTRTTKPGSDADRKRERFFEDWNDEQEDSIISVPDTSCEVWNFFINDFRFTNLPNKPTILMLVETLSTTIPDHILEELTPFIVYRDPEYVYNGVHYYWDIGPKIRLTICYFGEK